MVTIIIAPQFKINILLVLLFGCCLLLSGNLFAQKYYETGYVVLNDGDTIFGKVKDRTPEPFGQLYDKIRFKNGGLFAKRYGPNEISAYKAGDNVFESRFVKPSPIINVPLFNFFEEEGEQRFAKVITKGALTYYHLEWRDPDSGYYDFHGYLSKKDSGESLYIRIGLFGYNKERMKAFLNDCPILIRLFEDGGKPLISDIVSIYNYKCLN